MDGFQSSGQNLAIADQGKKLSTASCDSGDRVKLLRWNAEGTLGGSDRLNLSEVDSTETLFAGQPATLRFLLWHLSGKSDDRT
jgi:hypothetical protein